MQRYRSADSTSAQPRSPHKIRVVLCEDHNPFRVAEMDEQAGAVRDAARVRTETTGDRRRDRWP